MPRLRSLVLLAGALCLACSPSPPPPATLQVSNDVPTAPAIPPAPEAPATGAPAPPATLAPLETAALSGVLTAPVEVAAVRAGSLVSDQTGSLVSDQTGSLVSDQTGSLVSDQTGSLVSDQTGSYVVLGVAGGYRALAIDERRLARTAVYLADAAMRPIKGFRPVETDAEGRFTFPAVPKGFTYQVTAVVRTAGGKLGRLSTIAAPGANAAISSASSLVAASALADAGPDGLPGDVEPAAFERAVTLAQARLKQDDLPDFADRAAVAAKGAAVAAGSPILATVIGELRVGLTSTRKPLADLLGRMAGASPAPATAPPVTAAPAGPGPATPTPIAPMPTPAGPAPGPTGQATPATSGLVASSAETPCSASAEHEIALAGTYVGYPLTLRIVAPNGTEVASALFGAADARPTMSVPTGCPHKWGLFNQANQVVAGPISFVVQVGAPRVLTVKL